MKRFLINNLAKVFDFLASLKLAVTVIVSIGVLTAWGTIVEAQYDAHYAQATVYHSFLMYFVMIMLCINLIAVMIDRLPWKRRHIGFLMAHIGIILTLVGSLVTKLYGVDGSMAFPIGKSNRFVTVNDRVLSVYAAFADSNPTLMHAQPTDFLVNSPKGDPLEVKLEKDLKLTVTDYSHFSLRRESFVESEAEGPKAAQSPALRFQLQNDNTSFVEWVRRDAKKATEVIQLGPAKVVLSDGSYKYSGGNELILTQAKPAKDGTPRLQYKSYLERTKGVVSQGFIGSGESFETGWMGLTFRLLRYFPSSEYKLTYEPVDYSSERTNSAIKVTFGEQERWIGLNSIVKFFMADKVYYVSYGNKRIDLGFEITLDKFQIGRYQGTMRAATYESDVTVPNLGKVNISMNEPMKYAGYTFYQASFEEDDEGNPTVSVLSVNKDPGRWIKYLGSFLIVLGSIILFYFKRMKLRKEKKNPQASAAS